MSLEEIRKKEPYDYSLRENIVVALIFAGVLLCAFFDVVAFIATVLVDSIYILLLIIPITLFGAILFGLMQYINPN